MVPVVSRVFIYFLLTNATFGNKDGFRTFATVSPNGSYAQIATFATFLDGPNRTLKLSLSKDSFQIEGISILRIWW